MALFCILIVIGFYLVNFIEKKFLREYLTKYIKKDQKIPKIDEETFEESLLEISVIDQKIEKKQRKRTKPKSKKTIQSRKNFLSKEEKISVKNGQVSSFIEKKRRKRHSKKTRNRSEDSSDSDY